MFKVGDICKIKVKHDYALYRFIRIDGNRAYLQDRLGFTEFGINKDVVAHATPEEIAAGHRIDTNTGVTVITPSGASKVKGGLTAFVDMGDDTHIENHVSPNCKKFDKRVK